MRSTFKRLSVLCSGVLLYACADLGNITPHQEPGAQRQADDAYAKGREHHYAHRYADAIAAYRAALAASPRHVNARNGLASVYAEQGDYTHAIPIWRELTASANIGSGPGAAFLFRNLGYAYFLSGDYPDAQAALEKACVLDPLNPRGWEHLGGTLQKLGQDERAEQMFRQARALDEHDFRADYAAAAGGKRVAAIETAVQSAPPARDEWGATELHVAANGMVELRRVPPKAAPKLAAGPATSFQRILGGPAESMLGLPAALKPGLPAPLPTPLKVDPAAYASALLEIRNGNGVTGMAKSLSRNMGDPSLKVVRLTNEKGFGVRQTRVEYRASFRAAAERLAKRLDNAAVVEVADCKKTDMRLVIGRDLARKDFALRPLEPATTPTLAVASASDKSG